MNEARALFIGMNAHMNMVSSHAKSHWSIFFHFPAINKCHIFGPKYVFLLYGQDTYDEHFIFPE